MVRPVEMSVATGFVVIAYIISAIGLLVFFNVRINENNGKFASGLSKISHPLLF
jgi:tetrahydromethanopterin S-methyltransferase subunit C